MGEWCGEVGGFCPRSAQTGTADTAQGASLSAMLCAPLQDGGSHQPAGVFDRSAIKAVRKFLYQPPVYNDTSVKVNNVQIVLTFRLAD